MAITVFVTQLVFIGFRTLNVKAVSKGNTKGALITGAIVHLSWLVGIAIGAVSTNEIISNWDWKYLPVVLCSLSGGLLGTYLAMKEKLKKK